MQVESISIRTALSTPAVDVSGGKANVATSDAASSPPTTSARTQQDSANNSFPSKQPDQLEKAIDSIQSALKDSNITLRFSRDDDSGAIVVKWIDQASGEAVQQIPTETILHLAATLGKLQGKLFNQKA